MTARLPACQSGTRHPDTWHSTDPDEQAEARGICLACPQRTACQTTVMTTEAGLSADYRHGIWAALDGTERAALDPTAGTRRPPAPCGTPAGYRAHIRHGEQPGAACKSAQHDHDRLRNAA